jgi:hypothetical protein
MQYASSTYLLTAAMVILLGTSVATLTRAEEKEAQLHARQEEVAQRGATVMPFDLSRTTHVFDDEADGGLQTVTANNASDTAQIELIRYHLADEVNRFARGNFADPAWIHGAAMPGLTELSRAYPKLKMNYQVLPTGASVKYTSEDPALVAAIHHWFAAQRVEHAAHGEMQHHP